MTTTTRDLDSLLAAAPDDLGVVLLAYSKAILAANTLDDLANEEFALLAKQLGHNASTVRQHFKRVLGYRRAVAAFDPEKLRIARVKETATRKDDALFNHGGRAAHEFVHHNELQPVAALKMVELDARRREAETPEQRESILEEIQAVTAEGERLAHRARAASNAVEELLRRRDKITMIVADADLFISLKDTDDAAL